MASGLLVSLHAFAFRLQMYDEGLLLTHAWLLSRGAVPYRDFYANYPPGILLLVDAVWRVVGMNAMALRWMGLAIHLGLGLAAGALAGSVCGRRFSLLTCGLVVWWLVALEATPYTWLWALALALAAARLALAARTAPGVGLVVATGVALGAAGTFRHDLLLVLTALGIPLALAWRVPPRWLALGAAGIAFPTALVWVPVLLRTPLARVYHDILLDQAIRVYPARALPLSLWDTTPSLVGPGEPRPGALLLVIAGPVLAAWAVASARRLSLDRHAAALLALLCLAALPPVVRRCDLFHALFGVAPALAVAGGLLERLARCSLSRAAAAAGLAGLLLAPLGGIAREWLPVWPVLPSGPPPYGGVPEMVPERRPLFQAIAALTRPGEPIWVGRTDHRHFTLNEADLYFLSGRPGGARYLQLDPGLITEDDVQGEVIADLDRTDTRVVVLSECCYIDEPNTSRRLGSDRLDRWLAEHFRVYGTWGRYRLLVR